ncbi:MAG: type II toxin-antitoxin system RelE/ParE family toxin [Rhodospirillales bacterium]|nr:type II toxin-antitoxin system RelE/ParE family toxin [Rhodospirillales bacterium]
MPKKAAEAIRAALHTIAAQPFAPHPQVKRLVGGKNWFRLRHGHWRALYRLERPSDTMIVERVKPRGDAYR